MTLHRQTVPDFDWCLTICFLQLGVKISVCLILNNIKAEETVGQLIRPQLNKILCMNNKKVFKMFPLSTCLTAEPITS